MNFLCLCPLWNHRHDTIESSLACFRDQWLMEGDTATLLFIDDRPQELQHLPNGGEVSPNHFVLSMLMYDRAKNLPTKYNEGLAFAQRLGCRDYDVVVVWDDDDMFLPSHLWEAAKAYRADPNVRWTYPESVFSTFGHMLNIEETGGRFWSSITVKTDLLEELGGFGDNQLAGYDQIFLGSAAAVSKPAKPKLPTYVYRWGGNNEAHCSGASKGVMDTDWWYLSKPNTSNGMPITPAYDSDCGWVLHQLLTKYPDMLNALGCQGHAPD